ncbi:DMT family transporter [Phototrophicus methaneseepsis]|uniref:DMT family transporter n=1 Tax=Phototrophicus methaneseepsis TaxID=2710758 RepID=A0A7S8ECS5_9CHLR|nr:DMT family transporter [Phototrophicus methaneseepsis]QPC84561.1 DMT family transporter [Phototrophicus methaneseepsis]
MKAISDNLRSIVFISLAMLIFSLQGIAVKWIGGDYSIMEIVLFRSVIAMPITIVLYRLEGGRGLPKTQQPILEYVRGFFLFLSYTTAFMALAALPLAEVDAIRFSGPLMITILSVLILRETVQPYRWIALIVGFIGVLFIVRPGTATFNLGSIFALISVLFYAFSVLITRKLKETDSSATQAYYSSLVYLIAAVILNPLAFLVSATSDAHPSIAFLLRAWNTPTLTDMLVMFGLGFIWAGGMYFVARAYSTAPATVVAPFEYVSLPFNMLWGFLFFMEVPLLATWIGATLTIASGLYILYRERRDTKMKRGKNLQVEVS